MDNISIPKEELYRLYLFLDSINYFLHQPLNYADIEEFAAANYPELRDLYYDVVPGWLTSEQKEEFIQRLEDKE